jgi:hypothetical protein
MGDLATRGLRQSDGSNLSRGFHIGKSRTLVNGNPDSAIPISRNGRSRDTWPPSIGRLKSISGFPHWKVPIHWGVNPRVSSDRSNGCRVFQPKSDGSDRFLTCGLSHDFLNVERSTAQILSWTLGIHGPKLFATHEDTGKQSGKAFNALLSPTNLTVVCDRRFPDGSSSVD